MNVYYGRPENYEEREDKEVRVYEILDYLGIGYFRVDHDPADTMEDCKAIEEALNAPVCKNLFLRNEQKTKFYLLIMPADKKFKTKDSSKQINSARLSFAESEFMEKYLDIKPGAVSIAGLMNDREGNVCFLADSDTLKNEYIGIHPCVNTSTIKIKTSDINIFIAAVNHIMTVVNL